ncbi:hypothetical protein ACFX4N_23600 [Priestia sp. YIM B13551]|uniref:hypothetical protein n=1 Tax=Priestia sp. YIM B13551 TaxID=3366306 RepID=UPI0036708D1C
MFTQPGIVKRHDTLAGAILFESGGYASISEEQYKDSRVTFSFPAPAEKIALIPKYLSDENFLFISLDKEKALHIGGIVKGAEKVYGEVPVANLIAETNNLVAYSNGTQFVVSLNNTVVFKFESALFVKGEVRIYGETGEAFYSCEIEEPQSIGWTTNSSATGVEFKVVSIEDKNFMKLKGLTDQKAEIYQAMSLTPNTYTLSFSSEGVGRCYVKSSTGTIISDYAIDNQEVTRSSVSFQVTATGQVTLYFETDQELIIGEVQIEDHVNETGYIPNTSTTATALRENSQLSYPIKDTFPNQAGSLYVKVTAPEGFEESAMATNKQMIVRTDNGSLRIDYKNSMLLFFIGAQQLSIPVSLSEVGTAEVLIGWNEVEMELTVNGETVSRGDAPLLTEKVTSLIFAEEGSIKDPIILEEWALFTNKLEPDANIQAQLPQAIMQSLFDGGISGQNVTWSEIPVAPFDHSPILVQKEDGDTLQKVSFFDYETGQYQTWNQEPFVYDGRSDFVEVAYNNLNEQFRDIAIRTEDGEKIGEPYRIEGKRFYFSLYSSLKPTLKNKTLYATYQVNDTYTIDYNIKAVDGYRINFAKHDGGKRIVYQEGNRYGESQKLATMIDMNPIQNQNHEGFLYVTNTVNKTDSFRITVTPDRLHADGASYSTLIIEPLDYQGNFLSHSNLEITADKGFIARHISKDAVEAQKRSGQYLYQYYAPYIQAKRDGEIIEDYIWITDKDNQIGICYKILLRPVMQPNNLQIKTAEKNILTAKTTIINYLLMYEGIEKYEDETLFSILDLNQDGRITMDEILVLETNQKDQDLTVILNQLREWEDTQNGTTTA